MRGSLRKKKNVRVGQFRFNLNLKPISYIWAKKCLLKLKDCNIYQVGVVSF